MSTKELMAGPMFMKYVVGFLFSRDFKFVLLVRKIKPAWQEGFWNGVGGKIEPGEDPVIAMVREMSEETLRQFNTIPSDWTHAATMCNPYAEIYFYFAHVNRNPEDISIPAANDVNERLWWFPVEQLQNVHAIANLQYLIPLCVHFKSSHGGTSISRPVFITESDHA